MSSPSQEVFAYIRVSSHEQAKDGKYGQAAQREAINRYCAANDFKLAEDHVVSEVETGTNDDREGLVGIFDKAEINHKQGIITHIVMFKMDRLSRTLEGLLKQTAKAFVRGTLLHSCESGENNYLNLGKSSEPSDIFVKQILMAAVEYDKNMINKRFSGGKRVKKSRGGYIGGPPPFGYVPRKINNVNDIAPDEAKVGAVRRLVELLRLGNSHETTASVMALEFPQVPVWTRPGKKVRFIQWDRLTVLRISKRLPLYERGEFNGKIRTELIIAP